MRRHLLCAALAVTACTPPPPAAPQTIGAAHAEPTTSSSTAPTTTVAAPGTVAGKAASPGPATTVTHSNPATTRLNRVTATAAGGVAGCWARIIASESGGNPRAVNPTSGAGGKYQFLPGSWRAYGGTGRPQDATEAEQDRVAQVAYARSGFAPWGGCP